MKRLFKTEPEPQLSLFLHSVAGNESGRGADTHAWFDYQHQVTAAYAMAMFLEDLPVLVAVECLGDFTGIRPDGIEICSVKHKDSLARNWTQKELTETVLVPLFRSWKQVRSEDCRCRFFTNGAVSEEIRSLGMVAEDRSQNDLGKLKRLFRSQAGAERVEVDSFFASFQAEFELPGRYHISQVTSEEYASRVLKKLRVSRTDGSALTQQLVRVVREKVLDSGKVKLDLNSLFGSRPPRGTDQIVRMLGDRVIEKKDLLYSLAEISNRERLGINLQDIDSGGTVLRQKLRKGGLGPTAIRSASKLRANWSEYEAAFRQPFETMSGRFADTRVRILEAVADSEARAQAASEASGNAKYGTRMKIDIGKAIRERDLTDGLSLDVDENLLLGLVYQLTDECDVWWSEQFDE